MSNVYAAAIVFKSDAGDENDVTEELIDALTASRLPVDIRFIGGAAQVPETDDEYDSETVAPYIAGQRVVGKIHPAVLAATRALPHLADIDDEPTPEAGEMSTSDGLGAAASVEQAAVQACFNLAEYLNAQDQWNGGDVCEVLAAELNKAGYEVKGADDPLSRFSITCRPQEGWTITFDALPYQPFKAPLSMSESEAIAAATTKARAFV